jgi:voltage-gated potassium channel
MPDLEPQSETRTTPDAKPPQAANLAPWRNKLHEIIFEADSRAGKLFDIALLIAIGLSVLAVMLESVPEIRQQHETLLQTCEWIFTILFTIEYVLRLLCVRKPWKYVFSFYGIVDLLAVLPSYLGLMLPGSNGSRGTRSLMLVRALRMLRIFRIFKLAQFLSEATAMRQALWASRAKLIVFLSVVVIVVCLMGAAMHLVEGDDAGFTSIPTGIYWAIVTMTTVGYGDIAPETTLGKSLASVMMVLGYSLIIIPTGIVGAEMAQHSKKTLTTQVCPDCSKEGHDVDAKFCKFCGGKL